MNDGKKQDSRFWSRWAASGAVAPHFSLETMQGNIGLRIQCGMMLDGFPAAVTTAIEDARDSLEKIVKIIAAQPASMIDTHFTKVRGRNTRINRISALIYAFFAYRETIGK